jgi:hypothetical protein
MSPHIDSAVLRPAKERNEARELVKRMAYAPDETGSHAYETMESLICEMQGLRDELEEAKRERDEARLQYSTTLVFCQSLVKARLEEMEVAGE